MKKEEAKIAILDFVDLQNQRTELLRSIVIEENSDMKKILEQKLDSVCKDIDYLLEKALTSLGW